MDQSPPGVANPDRRGIAVEERSVRYVFPRIPDLEDRVVDPEGLGCLVDYLDMGGSDPGGQEEDRIEDLNAVSGQGLGRRDGDGGLVGGWRARQALESPPEVGLLQDAVTGDAVEAAPLDEGAGHGRCGAPRQGQGVTGDGRSRDAPVEDPSDGRPPI